MDVYLPLWCCCFVSFRSLCWMRRGERKMKKCYFCHSTVDSRYSDICDKCVVYRHDLKECARCKVMFKIFYHNDFKCRACKGELGENRKWSNFVFGVKLNYKENFLLTFFVLVVAEGVFVAAEQWTNATVVALFLIPPLREGTEDIAENVMKKRDSKKTPCIWCKSETEGKYELLLVLWRW